MIVWLIYNYRCNLFLTTCIDIFRVSKNYFFQCRLYQCVACVALGQDSSLQVFIFLGISLRYLGHFVLFRQQHYVVFKNYGSFGFISGSTIVSWYPRLWRHMQRLQFLSPVIRYIYYFLFRSPRGLLIRLLPTFPSFLNCIYLIMGSSMISKRRFIWFLIKIISASFVGFSLIILHTWMMSFYKI